MASNIFSDPSSQASQTRTTYVQRLLQRVNASGNTLCVGLDPVLKRIPGDGDAATRFRRFFENLLKAMVRTGLKPAAVKPNSAYFEAQGPEAFRMLQGLMADYAGEGILVILDAKRGDIATSSSAYAEAAFTAQKADAVTVAPYMGEDSVRPFQRSEEGKGVYVLVRTSNPGAKDFQELEVLDRDGRRRPLFHVVAEKVAAWDQGDLGAVVGATAPQEMETLVKLWKSLGKEIPMLIPGISVEGVAGGQGGDVKEVMDAIRSGGGNPRLHLCNSSSGVNYAYERYSSMAPADASLKVMEKLIEGITKAIGR
jgi:orotidine-5'-phosphate decarboxylase